MRKTISTCATAIALLAASSAFAATTAQATILVPKAATNSIVTETSVDNTTLAITSYIFDYHTQWSLDSVSGKIDLCYTEVTNKTISSSGGVIGASTSFGPNLSYSPGRA